MAKVWIDAGELLEKTMDLEIMYENNLKKVRIKNKRENVIDLQINNNVQGRKGKKVECFNVITGETKVFDTTVEASKYVHFTDVHIANLARTGKVSKNGWKARYIQEVTDGISECRASN
ncbi:putative phage protein [Clostridioides difficile CD160]|nr:putative phage protein [Clostridioides difficile CD160]